MNNTILSKGYDSVRANRIITGNNNINSDIKIKHNNFESLKFYFESSLNKISYLVQHKYEGIAGHDSISASERKIESYSNKIKTNRAAVAATNHALVEMLSEVRSEIANRLMEIGDSIDSRSESKTEFYQKLMALEQELQDLFKTPEKPSTVDRIKQLLGYGDLTVTHVLLKKLTNEIAIMSLTLQAHEQGAGELFENVDDLLNVLNGTGVASPMERLHQAKVATDQLARSEAHLKRLKLRHAAMVGLIDLCISIPPVILAINGFLLTGFGVLTMATAQSIGLLLLKSFQLLAHIVHIQFRFIIVIMLNISAALVRVASCLSAPLFVETGSNSLRLTDDFLCRLALDSVHGFIRSLSFGLSFIKSLVKFDHNTNMSFDKLTENLEASETQQHRRFDDNAMLAVSADTVLSKLAKYNPVTSLNKLFACEWEATVNICKKVKQACSDEASGVIAHYQEANNALINTSMYAYLNQDQNSEQGDVSMKKKMDQDDDQSVNKQFYKK